MDKRLVDKFNDDAFLKKYWNSKTKKKKREIIKKINITFPCRLPNGWDYAIPRFSAVATGHNIYDSVRFGGVNKSVN